MTDPTSQDPHPGLLGDGTEEQNLNQPGDPSRRITEDEVGTTFGEGDPKPGEEPDVVPTDEPVPIGDPDVDNGGIGDPDVEENPITI